MPFYRVMQALFYACLQIHLRRQIGYSACAIRLIDKTVKQYCSYHPVTSAHAACSACNVYYCARCLEATAGCPETPNCPHCKGGLEALDTGKARGAAPHILQSLLAPLHTPLRLGLLCSLLIAGSFAMLDEPATAAYEGLVIALSALCSAFALSLIDHKNRSNTPHRAGLIVVAMLAYGLPWLLFQLAGPWTMLIVALLCSPLLCFGLLAALQSRQLSWAEIWQTFPAMLSALKHANLLLIATAAVTLLSWTLLMDASRSLLPESFGLPLMSLFVSYTLLLFGHWSHAWLVYHGLQNGTASAAQHNAAIKAPAFDPVRATSAQIDMALKEGKYHTAKVLLEEDIKLGHRQLRAESLYVLLRYLNDEEGLLRHSHLFLRWMLFHKHDDKALAFLAELRRCDAAFRIHDADLCLQLAACCRRHKQHKQLLWLANEAHIRFEGEAAVAEIYLLAAKTLVEAFDELGKAQNYLKHIVTRFGESEAAGQAGILLTHIEARTTKRGLNH